MSTKYKQELDELSPSLKPSWLCKYHAVLSFAKKTGNLNIPWTDPQYEGLRAWLRHQPHRVRLSTKEKELLDALKVYQTDDRPTEQKRWEEWHAMFQSLMKFYEINGHFVVPEEEDKPLYNWIKNQRQKYRNNTLWEERKRKLEESGFPLEGGKMVNRKRKYTPQQIEDWNIMFGCLEGFYHEFGHCRVPVKYDKEPRLPDWVKRQRKSYRLGKIDQERQTRLESLEFPWLLKGNKRSY